jgi:hypothetical protein
LADGDVLRSPHWTYQGGWSPPGSALKRKRACYILNVASFPIARRRLRRVRKPEAGPLMADLLHNDNRAESIDGAKNVLHRCREYRASLLPNLA